MTASPVTTATFAALLDHLGAAGTEVGHAEAELLRLQQQPELADVLYDEHRRVGVDVHAFLEQAARATRAAAALLTGLAAPNGPTP